jgi:TRAP-type mannitol/chloroaromatic compound transport system permease large subunit
MQTSFLTPPFGFALFYMRSVAPNGLWKDKATGRMIDGVTTAQIYRGGISFILLQLIMIAVVVLFPWLAIGEGQKKIDTENIQIELPSLD